MAGTNQTGTAAWQLVLAWGFVGIPLLWGIAVKDALLEGLKALGYVEGKNIHVDYRVARKPEDVAEMARDLVAHKVDVITTVGPLAIEAARRATDSIPIVIIACDRADRLVASIARPGGNITGMASK